MCVCVGVATSRAADETFPLSGGARARRPLLAKSVFSARRFAQLTERAPAAGGNGLAAYRLILPLKGEIRTKEDASATSTHALWVILYRFETLVSASHCKKVDLI